MSAVTFVYFFAYFILALGLMTVVEANFPDSWVGRAFGVLH
jgi:hypothetical protein